MNFTEHLCVRAAWNRLLQQLLVLYPDPEARSIANEVFFRLLNFRPDQRILQASNELDMAEIKALTEAGNRLADGVPVQYVTGVCTFLDCELVISPAVLIPRKETEELVHYARKILTSYSERSNHPLSGLHILDIGTGSGCIAIALSKSLGGAAVSACDISEQAIEVARKNALKNNVVVNYFICDILSDPLNDFDTGSLDCVISNPPYVRHSEKRMMHRNVLNNEPPNALFVDDDDPLVFYRSIAEKAYEKLCSGGVLLFEINEYLGNKMIYMLDQQGYKNVQLKRDLNDRDRFVFAVK